MYVFVYDGVNPLLYIYVQAAAPKPKPKVEDGIFGTSGGIGFTKENELFVGRVAMLGFAVSIRKTLTPLFCSCISAWSVFMHASALFLCTQIHLNGWEGTVRNLT